MEGTQRRAMASRGDVGEATLKKARHTAGTGIACSFWNCKRVLAGSISRLKALFKAFRVLFG